MFLFMLLAGVAIGWLLTWAAQYLPRFASSAELKTPSQPPLPLILQWQRHRQLDSWQLVAEAITPLALVYFWLRFGLNTDFLLVTGSFIFLLLVALIDIRYRLVLNIMIYPAIIIALIVQLLVLDADPLPILLGGLLAFGVFYLTAMLKPGQLGGGDVKLAAFIGLMFGFPMVWWALLIGAGAGAVMTVVLLLADRSLKTQIPYAPYLCAGAMIALLYNPFAGVI